MSVTVKEFGKLENGQTAKLYTMVNKNGTEASFTDLGAAWVTMIVPDRDGKKEDVVFGYDDAETYYNNPTSCGECVGRSANRIAKGHFVLEGKEYQLAKNNGENNLHSGPDKWAKKLFTGEVTDTKLGSGVTFRLLAPDGSQGYPGDLTFAVTYTLTDQDELVIEYRASSDKTTIINPTNHAYFNLRGHGAGDIGDQLVWINADSFTPADEASIPTGEIAPVEGTPMDFTIMKPIGQDINADYDQLKFGNGYDHNYGSSGHAVLYREQPEGEPRPRKGRRPLSVPHGLLLRDPVLSGFREPSGVAETCVRPGRRVPSFYSLQIRSDKGVHAA